MSASAQAAPVEIEADGPPHSPSAPARFAWAASLRHLLWDRHSIRARLVIIVVLIEIAAALVAGAVMILNARASTRAEIAASYRLAEILVEQTVRLARDDTPHEEVLAPLPLQLRFLRHVRITVRDAAGVAILPGGDIAAPHAAAGSRTPPPAWFYQLIAPPIESRVFPVVANGRPIGSVLIVSAPGDEITEAWERTLALAGVALPVNVAVVVALYLLFGRALAPLTALAHGLANLERHQYQVRLPVPAARDFVALTERFNALAAALETMRTENVRLWNRLVSAQDDERRRMAMELHDEVGPTLFGLKANATSIASLLSRDAPAARATARERAQEMLTIIAHLQAINRGLLNRLRPMALGHVPLAELLAQLVHDRAREHPGISFSFSAPDLARSYGDSLDLTLYRCVQESLTNALRHAAPSKVAVTLGETAASETIPAPAPQIVLEIVDDGRGFAADARPGLGLQGMRERVQAAGGTFTVASDPAAGTRVQIVLPRAAAAREAGADLAKELAGP